MENVQIPAYYVLSRTATEEQISKAISALSVTPIHGVFTTGLSEEEFIIAQRFSSCVMYADNEASAADYSMTLFKARGFPHLVISEGDFVLLAGYPDGTKEPVCL